MTGRKKLLFICTGNYYRSRYAEAVFNHLAESLGLEWRAFSRGLNIGAAPGDALSPHTREALRRQGIPLSCTGAEGVALSAADLAAATRTIALKESEHRPLMEHQFPEWADRIEYWEVHDLDCAGPDQALPDIHHRVETLAAELVGLTASPPVALR